MPVVGVHIFDPKWKPLDDVAEVFARVRLGMVVVYPRRPKPRRIFNCGVVVPLDGAGRSFRRTAP